MYIHGILNQKHDSFSNKDIKHTNASNTEEEIQDENTDPKTREEIRDQNTDEISMKTNKNQSSNSQMEMSLPSFGFTELPIDKERKMWLPK